MHDLLIIGGGAAGIFAAISAKEANPSLHVTLLEKSATLLSKVRISGGGRCNVTHACYDPHELTSYYPRGKNELLGPFHRFNPQHTISWFQSKGVTLKTEADGRIFPITDSSSTIIETLLERAKRLNVIILTRQKVEKMIKRGDLFCAQMSDGREELAKNLLLATGSAPIGYQWANSFGHTIQEPVPSLFTFNIPHFSLSHLSGISIDSIEVKLLNSPFIQNGPLLITHFGFSGPVILKLSAWGARFLYAKNYRTDIAINWVPSLSEESLFRMLKQTKTLHPQKNISSMNLFDLPKNLWKTLLAESGDKNFSSVTDKQLRKIAIKLHYDPFSIEGKTTHKEEFVTCGGVSLPEMDFRTMQSKISPGLFFAGEILDIDGVTGGFNFQNAWTTAFIAGNSVL